MRKTILVFFLLTVGFISPAMAGAMEDGNAAIKRGDIATAIKIWTSAAEQGDVALREHLAEIYSFGLGVPKNQAEGLMWYRKAAELGDGLSENQLGVFYWVGSGLPKDPAMAVSWWRKAADHGNDEAMLSLGKALQAGTGVAKNDAEAANWLMKAAKSGGVEAQLEIGQALANGRGIPQDNVRAYMWMEVAAPGLGKNDDRSKLDARKSLAGKMTPEQLKQAKTMAQACVSSSYRQCDSPAAAAPKTASQTLSKWFVHWGPAELLGEALPGKTVDSAVSVRGGILTTQRISYDDDEDATRGGVADVNSVPLARVKSFYENEFKSRGQTYYYIGVHTVGERDISLQLSSGGTLAQSEYPGFVQFGPEQGDLRDAVYAKLRALIGQSQ